MDRPGVASAPGVAGETGAAREPGVDGLVVGVLGGTGPQGRGLANRWAAAGQQVVLGSRSAERAAAVAAEIGLGVRGVDNAACARASDVVVVAVPWDGHEELLP